MKIETFTYDVRPSLHLADLFEVRVRVKAKGLSGKVYGTNRLIDRRYLSDNTSLMGELFEDVRRQIEGYLAAESDSIMEMARPF